MLHLLSRVAAALGVLLLTICLAELALAGVRLLLGGAAPVSGSDGGARELLERAAGDGDAGQGHGPAMRRGARVPCQRLSATLTGESASLVLPSPSWPDSFSPQQ